ncbi:MAG: hypothetical protein M5R36_29025 [Deltaproteobacteria bacterium]|nr:hypothetical protein [Deltaproteobacteria bacterium]
MSGAAGAIAIDAAILADVNNIAASVSGEPGDNRNAQAMALLEDAGLFNGGTWTFQDFHGSIVGGVGVETQSAISETSHQEAIREQVVNLRESQSGVTLEEEMANLMKFQHAFEASARLFNTVQELFDSLADLR